MSFELLCTLSLISPLTSAYVTHVITLNIFPLCCCFLSASPPCSIALVHHYCWHWQGCLAHPFMDVHLLVVYLCVLTDSSASRSSAPCTLLVNSVGENPTVIYFHQSFMFKTWDVFAAALIEATLIILFSETQITGGTVCVSSSPLAKILLCPINI